MQSILPSTLPELDEKELMRNLLSCVRDAVRSARSSISTEFANDSVGSDHCQREKRYRVTSGSVNVYNNERTYD